MTINQLQRPKFYQGQYLGPEDLTAVVEYGRTQAARHALGAHTWGIGMGLDLKEKTSASGTLNVYVQPGYAVDGFGRLIVVPQPVSIPVDLFKSISYDASIDGGNPAGRLVAVWLRYMESATAAPAAGFQVCDTPDQLARFQESYQIEIGDKPAHADRHDPVSIAGRAVDAQQALQSFDPTTQPTLIYDESIPYQAFPALGVTARWYIPLGYVRWVPNADPLLSGQFGARNTADQEASRRQRRTLGAVAGEIAAVDKMIRLRSRTRDYSGVWTDDLVWVEGNLRVEGDARLLNGKVDWRNSAGSENNVPLRIQRAESNGRGGTDLQVIIGSAAAGKNAFAVGTVDTTNTVTEKFVVQDDGKVGIGTTTPGLTLDVRGDLGRDDGAATLHLWGSRIGDVGNGILFIRSGGNVVAFDGGDLVGVGTAAPVSNLHIVGDVALESRASGTARALPGNATMYWNDGTWLRLNQNLDYTKPIFGVHTPGLFAPGSLNVGGAGAWGDPGPGNGWVSGSLGIGTTTLGGRLVVTGSNPLHGTLTLFAPDADMSYDGGTDGLFLFKDTGGRTAFTGGKIGISTVNPVTRLHVVDTQSGSASLVASHVALIDNASTTNDADVLALRVGIGNPTGGNNFITFFGGATPVGRIEGDSAFGVSFASGGADFAEALPRLDPVEPLEPGDVIGIVGGKATRATTDAEQVMAITDHPIILGNSPDHDRAAESVPVAFVGQVAVKVRGAVRAGDYIAASGLNDGVGIAIPPHALTAKQVGRVLGKAWQSSNDRGVKRINTVVGASFIPVYQRDEE